MPVKPSKKVLDLAHKTLDPKEVLTVIIAESPDIKKALFDADLIEAYDKQSGQWLTKSKGGYLED